MRCKRRDPALRVRSFHLRASDRDVFLRAGIQHTLHLPPDVKAIAGFG
jgi:hypothetical protein